MEWDLNVLKFEFAWRCARNTEGGLVVSFECVEAPLHVEQRGSDRCPQRLRQENKNTENLM